jgi:hypothetical protein
MARISSIAFLALALGITGAEADAGACMLAVTNGGAELARAGTFLWSAIERCQDTEEGTQCSSDIFSTVEYVLQASSFITKSIAACGDGSEKANQCQLTSLKLASAASGLTAASLEMNTACKPKTITTFGKKYPLDDSVPCLGNIAGSVTGLGTAIAGLATIKDKCKNKLDCYSASLDILSTIAGMGGAIFATISGSCIVDKSLGPHGECVAAMVSGAQSLMSVGSSALTLDRDCKLSGGSRLFEEEGFRAQPGFAPVNIGLAALFPFTAVVAFIRGTRDAKGNVAVVSEDAESLM